MRRERFVQLGALGAMLGCLAASGVLTTALASSAGRSRLVYTDRAEEGDPPEVALGIAMGAFRGLFVNILWMRANDRKNEGRYYDAVELARTITRLQPRFPRVWAFHAWNLAYNISVTTNTPEERWNWVQQGIRLLRDEGIPKNPNDILLHKELAWILNHKVQGYMDDANAYYKREFAAEWQLVLGAPPKRTAETMDIEARTEQFAKWMSQVVEAPDSLSDAIAREPKVQTFIDRLKTETSPEFIKKKLSPDKAIPRLILPPAIDLAGALFDERGAGQGEQLLKLTEEAKFLQRLPEFMLKGLMAQVHTPEEIAAMPAAQVAEYARILHRDSAIQVMGDPDLYDARNLVIAHIRKRIIADKYHMSPARMVQVIRDNGPVDWRHPSAHALYWSTLGVDEAQLRVNELNRKDADFLNTDRMRVQAIQELRRSGEIYFDLMNPGSYLTLPNADFIPAYGRILEAVMRRGGIFTNAEKRTYTQYAAGYENFLRDSVRYLYRRGDRAGAQKYFEMARDFNKQNLNDPARIDTYSHTLDEFVANEIKDDNRFGEPSVARDEIMGALQGAFLIGLLNKNPKVFKDSMDYAEFFHKIFIDRQLTNVAVNQGDKGRMEAAVFDRDFHLVAGNVLASLINALGLPDGPELYRNAPDPLKAWSYRFLQNSTPLSPDRFAVFFPESPEWPRFKEYLAQRDAERKANLGKLEQQ